MIEQIDNSRSQSARGKQVLGGDSDRDVAGVPAHGVVEQVGYGNGQVERNRRVDVEAGLKPQDSATEIWAKPAPPVTRNFTKEQPFRSLQWPRCLYRTPIGVHPSERIHELPGTDC
ncbi:hypothetical protein [Cryobacterium sp. Hb1]|uniref:hypothetical protein n=1 Tax=Cryobacterium sp. Hb1 TaxID=1259147 RepID=UPI001069A1B2|nr:hypothetical protein [Cryobacterium sp. Hb1]TFD70093.1 hypothetical protein E3T38_06600 [Cryobacterium sp. Hb1]